MASITVPGVVDSVNVVGSDRVTVFKTVPDTDRPAVEVTLKQASTGLPLFAATEIVAVTIKK